MHICDFAYIASYGLFTATETLTISASFHAGYITGLTLTLANRATLDEPTRSPVTVTTTAYNETDSGQSTDPLLAIVAALSPDIAARLATHDLRYSLLYMLHDPDGLTHHAAKHAAIALPTGFTAFPL